MARRPSRSPEDWSEQDDEILKLLEERLAEEEKGLDSPIPGPEWGSPEEGARLFEAIRQSDPERAMSTLEAIVQDRPDYLPARIELGNLFFERGDLESASTAYEAALELDPDCVEALYNLANVYYRLEKFAASSRLRQRMRSRRAQGENDTREDNQKRSLAAGSVTSTDATVIH